MFQDAYQVLTWRSPDEMKRAVRVTLGECAFTRGVSSAHLAAVEGMMYGCRVAEVLTICLTANTLDGLCIALRSERDHVTAMYEEDRRVERLRLEHAAAAGHPQPPRPPPPPPPPPAQWPPQEQPPPAQWPPPPEMAGPSHPPTGHRRVHLKPGFGAAGAPPPAGPPPGGTAAAGEPLPPPTGVWAPRAQPGQLGARLHLPRGTCPGRRWTSSTRIG